MWKPLHSIKDICGDKVRVDDWIVWSNSGTKGLFGTAKVLYIETSGSNVYVVVSGQEGSIDLPLTYERRNRFNVLLMPNTPQATCRMIAGPIDDDTIPCIQRHHDWMGHALKVGDHVWYDNRVCVIGYLDADTSLISMKFLKSPHSTGIDIYNSYFTMKLTKKIKIIKGQI